MSWMIFIKNRKGQNTSWFNTGDCCCVHGDSQGCNRPKDDTDRESRSIIHQIKSAHQGLTLLKHNKFQGKYFVALPLMSQSCWLCCCLYAWIDSELETGLLAANLFHQSPCGTSDFDISNTLVYISHNDTRDLESISFNLYHHYHDYQNLITLFRMNPGSPKLDSPRFGDLANRGVVRLKMRMLACFFTQNIPI